MLSGIFGLEQVVESGSLSFVVIDGSTVQEPGATETTYRLHIAIDLINLTLRQVEVSTDKIGESLDHYALASGDVVLIDRGYNQPKSLVPFIDRGGDIVLRYNAHSMNLYEDDGQGGMMKIDWEKRLQSLGKQAGAIPVYLCHDKKRMACTVHAVPLPAEKAAQARRKAKLRAQNKGRTAREKTLYLSEWVLILTSVPVELVDTKTAAALYRVRWQVELVIKRMKSLLAIDQLRARKDSALAELYLHGKLLYAAVTEKIAQRCFARALTKLDGLRELTPWRLYKTIAEDIKSGLNACFPRQKRFDRDYLRAVTERPRKRSLQCLPEPITELIQQCRKLEVSRV